ncbi:MAG: hypothetical protein OH319_04360 [Candidatus Parvarchaeota archaeon]|nr:hypothetical protein [Candidatus Jingweiarchaeum tengchongense]MCW1297931.1 hypothetical protein [Candidatus Jingweiarchaeum tengchongense]MCW1300650.1 hypothetical protein [Candidatus Jingweiarchaeum tengchongense]MCW1304631.1 hypothetical protein [Candidatus Jingweiarchaeum tengchongense]MCW1305648.1 hypothetical protein [Candidatus Jingweiarchaeum tengchongense]
MKYRSPNLTEKVLVLVTVVTGIIGLILFYAAMSMPTIEGPWGTITSIMSWITVLVLLIIAIELEGIRDSLKK